MPDPVSLINPTAASSAPMTMESAEVASSNGQGSFGYVMKQVMAPENRGSVAKDEPKTPPESTPDAKNGPQPESKVDSKSDSKIDSKSRSKAESKNDTGDQEVTTSVSTDKQGLPPDGMPLPQQLLNTVIPGTESGCVAGMPGTPVASSDGAAIAGPLDPAIAMSLAAGAPFVRSGRTNDVTVQAASQNTPAVSLLSTGKTLGGTPGDPKFSYTLPGTQVQGGDSLLQAGPYGAGEQVQTVPWDAELIRLAKEMAQSETPSQGPTDLISDLSAASVAAPIQEPARSAPVATPLSTSLDVGFRQPGWSDGFANHVVWLVKQDVQAAEIRLNPAQLGPVEIRVALTQDQASVSLSAHHAAVREAMEAALPRLREMFTQAGINLADVNISQHFPGQERQAGQDGRGEPDHRSGLNSSGAAETDISMPMALAAGTSLVDLYA